MKNQKLWNNISSFELDNPLATFTFSQRLARDNNWSHSYSLEVINEYKRFIYLSSIGIGEITPSDAVDQAWHLHLTYTHSYWIELCRKTLGKEIHHNPTVGGDSQKIKFNNCYTQTQRAYIQEFGENPPIHIWPDNETRFSDIKFKRINLSNYWLIQKPRLKFNNLYFSIVPILFALLYQEKNLLAILNFILVVLGLIFFDKIIVTVRKRQSRNNKSEENKSFWDDFWGCSSDNGCSSSGCSSHGCNSCSSGCSSCSSGCSSGCSSH